MKITALKTYLANWREWELNPIVLKELRQAVRSWTITGMLLLFLLALFVVSIGFLVGQSMDVNGNDQLGESLFDAFLVVLAVAGILFIPLYTGTRVAAERQDNNPDLLYISTLSPGRIIRGKFFCAAYVALLFFTACLPFMALTNLLRGVDLPTVFFLMAYLYLLVCGANLAAIFLACLPISRLFKIVAGLAGFIALIYVVVAAMVGAYEMMRSGVGAMLFHRDFWETALAFIFLAGGIGGLFYVLSVALISPPSANRAVVPRIYVTLLWLGSGAVAVAAESTSSTSEPVREWAYFTSVMLVSALVVTISNHDRLSIRVRRTIPRGSWRRLLAFVFYNGAAGGLVWLAGLGLLTLGFAKLDPDLVENFGTAFPAMAMYFLAYALFALFIQRRFLGRFAPKIAGIAAVFITAITALATNIVLFLTNQLSWKAADHLELGNAFNVMGDHDAAYGVDHLACSFSLLVIAMTLNAKWFFTQWRNFRPPPDNVPPPLD